MSQKIHATTFGGSRSNRQTVIQLLFPLSVHNSCHENKKLLTGYLRRHRRHYSSHHHHYQTTSTTTMHKHNHQHYNCHRCFIHKKTATTRSLSPLSSPQLQLRQPHHHHYYHIRHHHLKCNHLHPTTTTNVIAYPPGYSQSHPPSQPANHSLIFPIFPLMFILMYFAGKRSASLCVAGNRVTYPGMNVVSISYTKHI